MQSEFFRFLFSVAGISKTTKILAIEPVFKAKQKTVSAQKIPSQKENEVPNSHNMMEDSSNNDDQ